MGRYSDPGTFSSRMYNGIGLRTARGTGTNGYVQKNLSFIKPKQQNKGVAYGNYKYDEEKAAVPTRKPSEEVLRHNSRRKMENEVLEYRETLIKRSKYTEEEIEKKIQQKRKELLEELERRTHESKDEVLMEAKEREMLKMKDAFGIKDGAEEGKAFKFDSEKQKKQRLERIAKEESARRFRPY